MKRVKDVILAGLAIGLFSGCCAAIIKDWFLS